MRGYNALREGAAWFDLSGRGHILAHGEDRKRLLHAMTTNHVQQLEPGMGCYAFFLNDRGRIIADVNILALPESLLLDVEPETRQLVYDHLDRFIIADDVTLEDRSAETGAIALEGPRVEAVLDGFGIAAPGTPYSHVNYDHALIARLSVTGEPGFRIFVPLASKPELIARLESAGVEQADAEAVRVVRLEHGRPRYGEEVTDRFLAQETQLQDAMHFSKGCYLGQEIVERVRSRGQVHRHLMRLEIESPQPPESGAKLTASGTPAAEVASAAYSPALGRSVALAYVRTEFARPGTILEGAAGPATVSGPAA